MRLQGEPGPADDGRVEPSAAPTRCPRCGAVVPPKAPWCSLCLTSTARPSPADVHPSAATAPSVPAPRRTSYGDSTLDPLTAPAEALGLPARHPSASAGDPVRPAGGGQAAAGWPCTACGATNPFTADVCAACGSAFLDDLRKAAGPLLELPVVGDITRLQRGQRLGLAFLVVLVAMALLTLLGLLLS